MLEASEQGAYTSLYSSSVVRAGDKMRILDEWGGTGAGYCDTRRVSGEAPRRRDFAAIFLRLPRMDWPLSRPLLTEQFGTVGG